MTIFRRLLLAVSVAAIVASFVEANPAAGMNHLSWLGKAGSAMEAARAEANREAGS